MHACSTLGWLHKMILIYTNFKQLPLFNTVGDSRMIQYIKYDGIPEERQRQKPGQTTGQSARTQQCSKTRKQQT